MVLSHEYYKSKQKVPQKHTQNYNKIQIALAYLHGIKLRYTNKNKSVFTILIDGEAA